MTDAAAEPPTRVLAVCLGNICRSPAAEAAIRHFAELEHVAVEVDSAGTGSWHLGDPPHAKSRRAGRAAGLEVSGSARQVSAADFERFDVILAMDQSNFEDLRRAAPDAAAAQKVRMFRSDGGDVPDPYFGKDRDYEHMIEVILPAAREFVAQLADAAQHHRGAS